VRLAEDLHPEDLLEQSVADVTTVSAIDNEIDKLTEELAAFCLDQLEKNIISSDDDVATWDLNMTVAEDTFEDESRVQDYIVITQ
jgi:glutathionylspermidine synthase